MSSDYSIHTNAKLMASSLLHTSDSTPTRNNDLPVSPLLEHFLDSGEQGHSPPGILKILE